MGDLEADPVAAVERPGDVEAEMELEDPAEIPAAAVLVGADARRRREVDSAQADIGIEPAIAEQAAVRVRERARHRPDAGQFPAVAVLGAALERRFLVEPARARPVGARNVAGSQPALEAGAVAADPLRTDERRVWKEGWNQCRTR